MSSQWIDDALVAAIREARLAEHGGLIGVRDAGLPASALARPKKLVTDEDRDVFRCATAHGFGLARTHPFIDGNERTACVAVERFLELEQLSREAGDVDCVVTMLGVADASIGRSRFATRLRMHATPSGGA